MAVVYVRSGPIPEWCTELANVMFSYELALGRLERLQALPPRVAYRRTVAFLLRRGFEPVIASA